MDPSYIYPQLDICTTNSISIYQFWLFPLRPKSGRVDTFSGCDSMFVSLRLRERVGPHPLLDIRLINTSKYSVRKDSHIWCTTHPHFHAVYPTSSSVSSRSSPDADVSVNVNAIHPTSSYMCVHSRPLSPNAGETLGCDSSLLKPKQETTLEAFHKFGYLSNLLLKAVTRI